MSCRLIRESRICRWRRRSAWPPPTRTTPLETCSMPLPMATTHPGPSTSRSWPLNRLRNSSSTHLILPRYLLLANYLETDAFIISSIILRLFYKKENGISFRFGPIRNTLWSQWAKWFSTGTQSTTLQKWSRWPLTPATCHQALSQVLTRCCRWQRNSLLSSCHRPSGSLHICSSGWWQSVKMLSLVL